MNMMADYNGWQYQKNGSSIQNEIEKALKKVLKKNTNYQIWEN